MFARKQRLLDELLVRGSADDDKLDLFVGIKLIRCPVMLGLGKVNGAMAPARRLCWVAWGSRPLQKRVDLQVRVGKDIRQMEAFCREAVADNANFDRGHFTRYQLCCLSVMLVRGEERGCRQLTICSRTVVLSSGPLTQECGAHWSQTDLPFNRA